jgi:hypothetical protein
MTIPHPIHLRDDLLLRRHERIDRTHAITLLRATFDACEGGHSIVDDYSDLFAGDGGTLQNYAVF